MQGLSKRFYKVLIPRFLYKVRLGLSLNKLFSYGVDQDDLWVYDAESMEWDVAENVDFQYESNFF
jgi:hypothetical protein